MRRFRLSRWLAGAAAFLSAFAKPVVSRAETVTFEGATFIVHRVDPAQTKLRLFWRDAQGQPYRNFRALDAALAAKNEKLVFAVNAGIYEPGWTPEGVHIEEGKELRPLNTADAPGNFYLKPNGVFFLCEDGRAGVVETSEFAALRAQGAAVSPASTPASSAIRLAVQSGPLLLREDRIHPKFNQGSPNRLLRNGVGVDGKGTIVFICSVRPPPGQPEAGGRINLHGFARLFRHLGCRDALFLDGEISEIFIRDETSPTPQHTTDFAAIFGVVE